jgi:hypothetical protein
MTCCSNCIDAFVAIRNLSSYHGPWQLKGIESVIIFTLCFFPWVLLQLVNMLENISLYTIEYLSTVLEYLETEKIDSPCLAGAQLRKLSCQRLAVVPPTPLIGESAIAQETEKRSPSLYQPCRFYIGIAEHIVNVQNTYSLRTQTI